MAVARRRIKTGGDLKAALALIPITKPIYDQYRDYLEREKPHLKVDRGTGMPPVPSRLAS